MTRWGSQILLLCLVLGWSFAAPAQDSGPGQPPAVGVEEHLGQYVPPDVVMRDEQGRQVNLRQHIAMPTVLVPVYYTCPNVCGLLMGSLSQVLPQVGLTPGRDYQVISVSFNERETPAMARQNHLDYTTAMSGRFPPAQWHFLTGDLENINRLMTAIGFHFQRQGDMFRHPVVLVVVSASGKITRYLYGQSPLAFDITMALTEAAGDKIGLSVTRALAFCYSYDPAGRRYAFNLMKVAGAAVLFAILLFLGFLLAGSRKRRQRRAAARELHEK